MIPTVGADDIVASAAMNGVPAHWMRQSIEAVGLDAKALPPCVRRCPRAFVMPWRDIWAPGKAQG